MENTRGIYSAQVSSWGITLVGLLPLWLLSVAIMAEGFPRPPISVYVGFTLLGSAITLSLVLLWQRRMEPALVLYSFIPFILLFIFDEIVTSYKTPFIVLCAIIFSIGALAYQRNRSSQLRWLFLLAGAGLALLAASHAAHSYFSLNVEACSLAPYPDCFPSSVPDHPWWAVFFGF